MSLRTIGKITITNVGVGTRASGKTGITGTYVDPSLLGTTGADVAVGDYVSFTLPNQSSWRWRITNITATAPLTFDAVIDDDETNFPAAFDANPIVTGDAVIAGVTGIDDITAIPSFETYDVSANSVAALIVANDLQASNTGGGISTDLGQKLTLGTDNLPLFAKDCGTPEIPATPGSPTVLPGVTFGPYDDLTASNYTGINISVATPVAGYTLYDVSEVDNTTARPFGTDTIALASPSTSGTNYGVQFVLKRDATATHTLMIDALPTRGADNSNGGLNKIWISPVDGSFSDTSNRADLGIISTDIGNGLQEITILYAAGGTGSFQYSFFPVHTALPVTNTVIDPTATGTITISGFRTLSSYTSATAGAATPLIPAVPGPLDMVGATATTDGECGFVPNPLAGDENSFLKGDGTWGTSTGDSIYTGDGNVPAATTASDAGNLTFDAGADATGVTFTGTGAKVATFNGNIDVSGLIDPTGIQFSGIQADSTMPNGTIYVTDGSLSGIASGEFVFKDLAGDYHDLENVDLTALSAADITAITQAIDFTQLTAAQVTALETALGVPYDLDITANILKIKDATGTPLGTGVDLSLYIDDTNLARIVSGTLNGATGIATITRDDASTFTIDFSAFLSDLTFTGATALVAGTQGDVPAPAAGDEDKYLAGDGTWKTINLVDEVVESAGALSGAAPTNAELGVDTTTGDLYYVVAGNWTIVPSGGTPEVIQSSVPLTQGGAAPAGAKFGFWESVPEFLYIVDASGNWDRVDILSRIDYEIGNNQQARKVYWNGNSFITEKVPVGVVNPGTFTPDLSVSNLFLIGLNVTAATINAPIGIATGTHFSEIQIIITNSGTGTYTFDPIYKYADGTPLGTINLPVDTKHMFRFASINRSGTSVDWRVVKTTYPIPAGAGGADIFNADVTADANHTHTLGDFNQIWSGMGNWTMLDSGTINWSQFGGGASNSSMFANGASLRLDVTNNFGGIPQKGEIFIDKDAVEIIAFQDAANTTELHVDQNAINLIFGSSTRLLINGDAGTAGEVLTSTGGSTPPTWQAPVAANYENAFAVGVWAGAAPNFTYTITAATHGLGTGMKHVTVIDAANDVVTPDVNINPTTGDVVLTSATVFAGTILIS